MRSFAAACHVLDVITVAKQGLVAPRAAAQQLDTAVSEFLRLHKAAYGTQYIKPKHHWLLDVGPQLLRDGAVLDAFVIERTHLLVKGVAEHVKNTSRYEMSVLSGVCNVAIARNRGDFGDRLLGRASEWPGMDGLLVARRMEVISFEVARGDVVLRGDAVGVVVACCSCGGELFALVQRTEAVMRETDRSLVVRPLDTVIMWPAPEIRHTLAWRSRPGGLVLVLCY